MKKYILAFLFLCYLLPSQAQIFYKERIYGQDSRKDIQDDDYSSNDYSEDTFDSTWINQPIYISDKKKNDRIYKKEDSEHSISLSATKEFMKQKGETNLVNEIERYQNKKKVSYTIRKVSRYALATSVVLLFALPASDSYRPHLYTAFGISIGLNVTGKILKYPSKKKIYQEIEAYNAGLKKNENSSFDKNFFPNFIPSKIIVKPVQMNLLNPTPVPTLGMTWNF